jgi:hypothetical protein
MFGDVREKLQARGAEDGRKLSNPHMRREIFSFSGPENRTSGQLADPFSRRRRTIFPALNMAAG